jgi:peroxiredoxin Q/BCP
LKLGDKLPAIKLRDEEGAEVNVASLGGDKGVVIFLYPKVSCAA